MFALQRAIPLPYMLRALMNTPFTHSRQLVRGMKSPPPGILMLE